MNTAPSDLRDALCCRTPMYHEFYTPQKQFVCGPSRYNEEGRGEQPCGVGHRKGNIYSLLLKREKRVTEKKRKRKGKGKKERKKNKKRRVNSQILLLGSIELRCGDTAKELHEGLSSSLHGSGGVTLEPGGVHRRRAVGKDGRAGEPHFEGKFQVTKKPLLSLKNLEFGLGQLLVSVE